MTIKGLNCLAEAYARLRSIAVCVADEALSVEDTEKFRSRYPAIDLKVKRYP